jgi:hypothetical protein
LRVKDASTTLDLFDSLVELDPRQVAEKLADFSFPEGVTAESVARSWRQAEPVAEALKEMNWELLGVISGFAGNPDTGAQAAAVIQTVRESMLRSELVTAVGPVLRKAERDATALVGMVSKPAGGAAAAAPQTSSTSEISSTGIASSTNSRAESGSAGLTSQADLEKAIVVLRGALSAGKRVDLTWTIRGEQD